MDPEPIFSELQVANQPGLGLGVGSLIVCYVRKSCFFLFFVEGGMLMMMDDSGSKTQHRNEMG